MFTGPPVSLPASGDRNAPGLEAAARTSIKIGCPRPSRIPSISSSASPPRIGHERRAGRRARRTEEHRNTRTACGVRITQMGNREQLCFAPDGGKCPQHSGGQTRNLAQAGGILTERPDGGASRRFGAVTHSETAVPQSSGHSGDGRGHRCRLPHDQHSAPEPTCRAAGARRPGSPAGDKPPIAQRRRAKEGNDGRRPSEAAPTGPRGEQDPARARRSPRAEASPAPPIGDRRPARSTRVPRRWRERRQAAP